MNAKQLMTSLSLVFFTFGCAPVFAEQRIIPPNNWTADQVAGRLADLRIFDRNSGAFLPVYRYQGKAYIAGEPGNEYRISINNRSPGDVLAVVSVDGVNVITGQTASSEQRGYIFSAGEGYDITGWRKNEEQSAAFYFTRLSDSYAGRTGRPGNVGVIGVALFQRKSEPRINAYDPRFERERPMAAPAQAPGEVSGATADTMSSKPYGITRQQSREPLGTGHGRIEYSPVESVQFERASDRPAEILALYYDSYANLVARGIIREPIPQRPGRPLPFPDDANAGFVPDPPYR